MSLLLIILGFGFVIFWHELGHFLAARWAGVRVEQFAVGMGQAVVSWRKGIGLRWMRWAPKRGFVWGSTQKDFDQRVDAELARRRNEPGAFKDMFEPTLAQRYEIARELGIGETEYRLSWIPIGGYVKPTGQDDLRPRAEAGSEDPKSYAAKSVGKRMVIISAGVMMNVILAAILFNILFLYGFRAPAASIGLVAPNSPAQKAGLQVGDVFESINGHRIHDFNKVMFNVQLLPRDRAASVTVMRDGKPVELKVQQVVGEESGMLQFGVGGTRSLTRTDTPDARELEKILPADPTKDILIGETIVSANGEPLGDGGFEKLNAIVQKSAGAPVMLTLKRADGSTRELLARSELVEWFNGEINFIGLHPRAMVSPLWVPDKDAKYDIQPLDVIASIEPASAAAPTPYPTNEGLKNILGRAQSAGDTVRIELLRGDTRIVLPSMTVRELQAMNVFTEIDRSPVVSRVDPASPAFRAGIPEESTILSIDGQSVRSWLDIYRKLISYNEPTTISLSAQTPDGIKDFKVDLTADALASVRQNRFRLDVMDRMEYVQKIRQTNNPLEAFSWGVGETRDLILKTYITIRRLTVDQTVPVSNLMGPLGMIDAGRLFALKGTDWLIWFLAMVSANLAVVNFLPLPIVDGGHFCFLLMEKITGKPASPRLMAATTYFGVTLLLGFFLFVTYNDVSRMFMR